MKYLLELQRPQRVVIERRQSGNAALALRVLRKLIAQCGDDGLVIVLKDGKEISYSELNDDAQARRRSLVD